MIEYDYEMKKRFGSVIKEYHPVFKKNIKNIAKLRGPTGSGKSTLMTMLALSCHGLDENANILDGLKDDMRDIYDDDDCEFKFSMKITDNHGHALRFETQKVGDMYSEKKNRYINIFETIDGKENQLGKDAFIKKYRLLYDMPYDPMKRLDALVDKIALAHKRFEDNIGDLNKETGSILQKINSTSKQSDIEEKEKKLKMIPEEIEKNDAEQKKMRIVVTKLKKYYASTNLKKAEANWNYAYAAVQKVKKAEKNKDKENKAAIHNYLSSVQILANHKRKVNMDLPRIHKLLVEMKFIDKIDLDYWGSITLEQKEKLVPQKIEEISEFVRRIEYSVFNEMELQNTKKEEELHELIVELVRCLERHKYGDMKVMGQTVNELCNRLNSELQTTGDKVKYTKKLKSLHDDISSLRGALMDLNKSLINMPPEPDRENNPDDSKEIENDFSQSDTALSNTITEAEKYNIKLDNYQRTIYECEKDPSLYEYIADAQKLPETIERMDRRLIELKKQSEGENGLGRKQVRLEEQIESMKKEKPHELSEYSDELKKLENVLVRMKTDLSKKRSLLNRLSGGAVREDEINNNAEFYNLVCRDLALAIGKVKSSGSMHTVSQIDIVNKRMKISGGMEIPFKYLNSGESQNMHLRGQLQNEDGRCIIALFDEVGLMDTDTLGNVLEKISELYKSGNLLVGWMAMPGDSSGVEEYE